MADEDDNRLFVPDPTPIGMDPEIAEWILRQLYRITGTSGEVVIRQEQDNSDLNAHIANQNDPHRTLLPWKISPENDLYPDVGSGEPGVGNLDRPVAHVALGTQELGGMEGFVSDRQDVDNGGLLMMGLRGVDPNNPPPPPLIGNAPVEISGNSILLMDGTVLLQVPRSVSSDTYLIAQPSITLPDGREVVPITLGPEVVYTQEEFATDANDYNVLDVGEVEMVDARLTPANSYDPDVSTFSFQVLLENLGNLTVFDVIIKLDGVEQVRYTRNVTNNTVAVVDSITIQAPVSAGQVISLWVEATSTHPQSQGWVRGSQQATTLRIKQG